MFFQPGILKKDFKKSQNKVTKVTFLNDEEPVKILGDRTNSSKTHCPAITRTKIKPAQQEDENDSGFNLINLYQFDFKIIFRFDFY